MTIPFPKSSGADCSAHKRPRRWLPKPENLQTSSSIFGLFPPVCLFRPPVYAIFPPDLRRFDQNPGFQRFWYARQRCFVVCSSLLRRALKPAILPIAWKGICKRFPMYGSVSVYHVFFSPSSLLCLQSGFIRVFLCTWGDRRSQCRVRAFPLIHTAPRNRTWKICFHILYCKKTAGPICKDRLEATARQTKIKYRGVAQLVARLLGWIRPAG